MADDLEAKRRQLRDGAARILKADHFDALSVKRSATADDVKKAYLELVKAWHPDRVPSGLGDLRPVFTEVFTRLDLARATLSDASLRLDYVGRLARGTMPKGAAEATVELRKAEALLKKNDATGAEQHARRAIQVDPLNVEALALVLSIEATKPDVTKDRLRALVKELDALVQREPSSVRALVCRAQLKKRLDRTDEAVADFRRVVELDPRNVDAAREVRLFEMRREKRAGVTDGAGGKHGATDASGKRDASGGEGGGGGEGIGAFFKKLFKR